MTKDLIHCGPWVGEFGWELCWWNPHLRYRASLGEKLVVSAPAGNQYLYEFAHQYIPLEVTGPQSFWEGELKTPMPQVRADVDVTPTDVRIQWGASNRGIPLKWRKYGNPEVVPGCADVLCAFRSKKVWKNGSFIPDKDYPFADCQRVTEILLNAGLTVACYGGSDNYLTEGCVDLRGIRLETLCNCLAAAKCAVGPSSGTIHLASLCGCPHVVWYKPQSHPRLHLRYEKIWNPFSTPVNFLKQKPPAPQEIADAVLEMCRAR